MQNDTRRASIVIAEDDRATRDSLVRALQLEGHVIIAAVDDGEQALAAVRDEDPDVLLLDVAMPRADGLAVAAELRRIGNDIPILMLTARTELGDRIAGLDAGADDYVPKPYHLDELLARIAAMLRRSAAWQRQRTPAPAEIVIGDVRLDPAGRRAYRGDRELALSKTEFDLLEVLMAHAGAVLDRRTLHELIWGADFGPESKNLAVFIGYLRRKTEVGGATRVIHTVRGAGYRFDALGPR